MIRLHVLEQLRAVHLRHAHVGNDDVERRLGHPLDRILALGQKLHLPDASSAPQKALDSLKHQRLVVDEQDPPRGRRSAGRDGHRRCREPAVGAAIVAATVHATSSRRARHRRSKQTAMSVPTLLSIRM
jgi:hypothetical protein